jgi:hypothetical protein
MSACARAKWFGKMARDNRLEIWAGKRADATFPAHSSLSVAANVAMPRKVVIDSDSDEEGVIAASAPVPVSAAATRGAHADIAVGGARPAPGIFVLVSRADRARLAALFSRSAGPVLTDSSSHDVAALFASLDADEDQRGAAMSVAALPSVLSRRYGHVVLEVSCPRFLMLTSVRCSLLTAAIAALPLSRSMRARRCPKRPGIGTSLRAMWFSWM